MAVLTSLQQLALNLPPLSDPVAYNGVSMPLATYLQSLLDTYGSWQAGLAAAFQMLMNFDRLIREQWGEYEYTLRTSMTFEDAFNHWTYVVRTLSFNNQDIVPTVSTNGFGLGIYPVVGLNL